MNGSPIQEDSIFNESIVLTVRGENLFGSHYGVFHVADGERVEYTPLGGTYDALEYILLENGRYEVCAEGFVRVIELEGLPAVSRPTSSIRAAITSDTNTNFIRYTDFVQENVQCLNYPVLPTEEYPRFVLNFRYDTLQNAPSYDTVRVVNATISARYRSTVVVALLLTPINPNYPVLVYVEGVLKFVGNYTN